MQMQMQIQSSVINGNRRCLGNLTATGIPPTQAGLPPLRTTLRPRQAGLPALHNARCMKRQRA